MMKFAMPSFTDRYRNYVTLAFSIEQITFSIEQTTICKERFKEASAVFLLLNDPYGSKNEQYWLS